MALPSTGSITTDQIMTELGISTIPREWGSLWALAKAGSIPKTKANAGGPYVFPDDWFGYTHTVPKYGGTIALNIPGVGTNILPSAPGSNVLSGYTLGSDITILNLHATEIIKFYSFSLEPLESFNISTSIYEDKIILPGSSATWLSLGKTGAGGVALLSIETYTTAGGKQQFYWTFSV